MGHLEPSHRYQFQPCRRRGGDAAHVHVSTGGWRGVFGFACAACQIPGGCEPTRPWPDAPPRCRLAGFVCLLSAVCDRFGRSRFCPHLRLAPDLLRSVLVIRGEAELLDLYTSASFEDVLCWECFVARFLRHSGQYIRTRSSESGHQSD